MTSVAYPASPSDIPRKLTGLSTAYTIKAALAILAIILFFALYTALVIALGYLFYLAVIFDIGAMGVYPLLVKLGAIAGAGMLLFFTIKFLFKLKNPAPANRIMLTREDEPQLWSFVERICEETGAPRPKAIYVNPDVNAYVSYTNIWLSLIFPVRKELTIGLGLVNCLNLSQFKGVVAHEFGHFSQRSMKIGSYINSANTIIHDMIFTRDKWDELLQKWKSADLRLSIAAWVITPIIGLIRQILRLFYSFLNIMYSSLSREMEFNADKVAVKVAGSEAIISALWNLDSRLEFWNSTINHAYLAAQKEIHSGNLYEQQSLAQTRKESLYVAALNELPSDERGGKRYFTTSEVSKVSMYASHPPNDQREANAKTPFVPCTVDERSPWILFSNPEELQHRMTRLIYQTYLEKTPQKFVEAEEFQRFVEAESEGQELAEGYDNTFHDRFIHLPSKEEMEASPVKAMEIAQGLQFLKDEVRNLMQPIREIETQMKKAQEIAGGTSKEKSLTFNGVTYTKKELQRAWETMTRRREEAFSNNFIAWDTAFFAVYLKLAEKVGRKEELERIYAQYTALTKVYRIIMNGRAYLINEYTSLKQMEPVDQQAITNYGDQMRDVLKQINTQIVNLHTVDFIPLPNIDTVDELQNAVIEGGQFTIEAGEIFEGGKFQRAMHALERAAMHCQRLDRKSIAHILQFHADIEEEYRATQRDGVKN